MNEPREDYLWDRSGAPDPEIERLERALLPLREDLPPGAPAFEKPNAGNARPERSRSPWRRFVPLAAAAGLAAVFAWALRSPSPGPHVAVAPSADPRWAVECISGSIRIEQERVTDRALLAAGQRLATQEGSRARVAVGEIGEVEIGANSSVRLVSVRGDEHRLALEHGTMRAFIWAPPRQFVVETPSAVATDLGCSYLLAVDERGAGRIEVTSGWVAFEHDGRESFVPADAVCRTEPGLGPGTPHYADASPRLVEALAAFDFLDLDRDRRRAALRTVLASARRADAFTLWHLLTRAPVDLRGPVYDALAALAPPPPGVDRAGATGGDRRMLDLWWNSLGLGEADWWRMWEGTAPGTNVAPPSPATR